MNFNKPQYKKMDTEQLVILAQENDYKAIEELVKREQKNIFATFSYLNLKTDNVYDLTQEALLHMTKGLHNLKNPKTFKSWLNQIVMHLFYDDLRKISRKPLVLSLDNESNNNEESQVSNPQNYIHDKKCKPMEMCLSHELDNMIKTEMRALPEHFRVPIVLRELQGLTYDEIAHITNTNVGTVKSRISRARIKLQDKLKNYI